MFYVIDWNTGYTNAEIVASLINVKSKDYTITSGATIDSVVGSYTGSVDITSDRPSGILLETIYATGFFAYDSAGAFVAIRNGKAVASCPKASTGMTVKVVWLYASATPGSGTTQSGSFIFNGKHIREHQTLQVMLGMIILLVDW